MSKWSEPVVIYRPKSERRVTRKKQPYLLRWRYPVFVQGKYRGYDYRHTFATTDVAIRFALKHELDRHDVPPQLRKEMAKLAAYVADLEHL